MCFYYYILILLLAVIYCFYKEWLIDTFYPRADTLIPNKKYYHHLNANKIPKIIHQLAPKDKTKWPNPWFECHDSVMKSFPIKEGFTHMMWTDEKIDEFVRTNFSEFYKIFQSYPYKINRIDMVRYMILFKYGGIYIDMDFLIKDNFYAKLADGKINLVGSIFFYNEEHQNSLMASPPFEDFWLNLLEISSKALKDLDHEDRYKSKGKGQYTLTMTGPRLLDALINASNKNKIEKIPYQKYGIHKNTASY